MIGEMHKFLEIFPESVVINSEVGVHNEKNVYANDKFNKEIADIKQTVDCMSDIRVSYTDNESNELVKRDVQTSLWDFFKKREGELEDRHVIEATVKIENSDEDQKMERSEALEQNSISHIYLVKTSKVNWDDNPDSFMHVFVEITDMLNLKQANKNIDDQKVMFASTSHEFRTPLNAILNSFDLIKFILEKSRNEDKDV